ncbi:MAG: hypothetical protein J6P72_00770 [Firmicutes bacterium]|nr:hypothetical protein [Bacillota bacterium]
MIETWLESEGGRVLAPDDEGNYEIRLSENEGFISADDPFVVKTRITLNLDQYYVGYDSAAYTLRVNEEGTLTLIIAPDAYLVNLTDPVILEGDAELVNAKAHNGYYSVTINARYSPVIALEYSARIAENSYKDIRLGVSLQTKLSGVLFDGIPISERSVYSDPLRIKPVTAEDSYTKAQRASELDEAFTTNVTLTVDSSTVSPMDMVLVASVPPEREDISSELDAAVASLKEGLVNAGINLHEGILRLDSRSVKDGLSLALEELSAISRRDAVKTIVLIADELTQEDLDAIALLKQEHASIRFIIEDWSLVKETVQDEAYAEDAALEQSSALEDSSAQAEETDSVKEEEEKEKESILADTFALVQDELLLTLKAGSRIVCEMAPSFVLVTDPETMFVSTGDGIVYAQEAELEYGESAAYTFPDVARLSYVGPEWTLNPYIQMTFLTDKTAAQSLDLRLQLQLTQPEIPSEEGVTYYGTYDRYGFSSYQGVDVFSKAYLQVVDRFGEERRSEYFDIPTVSYTALKIVGQYGNEAIHYFTADMAGTTRSLELDDETFNVSVSTDGFHTLVTVE